MVGCFPPIAREGLVSRRQSASLPRVERPCLSQTMPHATIGPPSGPRLRQPYRAPKNAPVVAYHCGHIVRKPTPNTRTPPAQTKQNFEDHWNERKWDRGRGLELAQRLDWPAESWGAPQLATDAPRAAMARAPYSDAMRRSAPDREAGPLAPRLGQSCGSAACHMERPTHVLKAATLSYSRLQMPAVYDHTVCAWEVRGYWDPPSRPDRC